MSSRLLRILFVDDDFALQEDNSNSVEYEELQNLLKLLKSTGVAEVDTCADYGELGDTTQGIRDRVAGYDLLILDVLMRERDREPFDTTLNTIGRLRPFLVYTVLPAEKDLQGPAGSWTTLADDVYPMGCLRIIRKPSGATEREVNECHHKLLEDVLWFYWCTIRAANATNGPGAE